MHIYLGDAFAGPGGRLNSIEGDALGLSAAASVVSRQVIASTTGQFTPATALYPDNNRRHVHVHGHSVCAFVFL